MPSRHNSKTLPVGMFILALSIAPAARADAPSAAPAAVTSNKAEVAAVQKQNSKTEIVWEWDPYYTDVDFNIPLTNKPIPTITSNNEAEIYRDLIVGSLVPRYMLLEASAYPMPVLGTYIKSHSPSLYQQGEISHTGVNVIESATAGFQEPWAVSAFFGNIANLVRPDETAAGSNLGYTGYLVSAGTKHIKDNVMFNDNWYEVEWKVKGQLDYPDEKLTWSFRIGGKFNANPDVTDVVYVGIHRSNLDFSQPFLGWLNNSDLDLQVQFSQDGGRPVYEQLVIGKKYPLPNRGYSFTLDVGLVWESPDEYSGTLRTDNKSSLTLVLRPSIEF
jgi:hypothetical protein